MNRIKVIAFLILLLILLAASQVGAGQALQAEGASEAPVGAERQVVRIDVPDWERIDTVAGELDIWEAYPLEGYLIAAVKPAQIDWLQRLGFRVEVDATKSALLTNGTPLDPRYYYFDDFQYNSYGRYVVEFLQDIATTYPDLTELYDIGDAWMAGQPGEHHRDIWILRITNEDPAFGPIEDKPAFFFSATTHAREVVVAELAIRYIRHLTGGFEDQGGYGVDADATWLVDHQVVYVLVMGNPDGHWANEVDIAAYRRKNMDWDDGCTDPRDWGVDLNRNHSFMWACCGGSSTNPCSDTYRGSGRRSEPETQAMEDFFATVMRDQNGPNGDDEYPPVAPDDAIGIFISLHSYGDYII